MSIKGYVSVCAACCVFSLLMASACIQWWVDGWPDEGRGAVWAVSGNWLSEKRPKGSWRCVWEETQLSITRIKLVMTLWKGSPKIHTRTHRKRSSLLCVSSLSFLTSFPPCKLLFWIFVNFVNSFHRRHLILVLASRSQIFLHKRPLKRDLYFQCAA